MNNVQLDGDLSLSYNQLMSLDTVTVDTLPEKKVLSWTLNLSGRGDKPSYPPASSSFSGAAHPLPLLYLQQILLLK